MDFCEIVASLGMEDYPEGMDAVYKQVKSGAKPLFDRELIDRQNQRQLFGPYYNEVVKGYEDLLTVDLGIGTVVIRSKQREKAGTKIDINIPAEELYYFDENQNRTSEILKGEVVSVYHADK